MCKKKTVCRWCCCKCIPTTLGCAFFLVVTILFVLTALMVEMSMLAEEGIVAYDSALEVFGGRGRHPVQAEEGVEGGTGEAQEKGGKEVAAEGAGEAEAEGAGEVVEEGTGAAVGGAVVAASGILGSVLALCEEVRQSSITASANQELCASFGNWTELIKNGLPSKQDVAVASGPMLLDLNSALSNARNIMKIACF